MQQAFNTVVIIGTVVILCSLILAINISNKKGTSIPIKHFYIYPLLAFLLSIVTILNKMILKISSEYINIIENTYFSFESIFWAFFFFYYFQDKGNKKVVIAIFSISILIMLIFIIINNINQANYSLIAIKNFAFTIYCLLYFVQLFKKAPTKKIKNEIDFWIIMGLFVYATLSIPLVSIVEYFRPRNFLVRTSISMSFNLLIIIMHLFFTKGYLCLIHQRKV